MPGLVPGIHVFLPLSKQDVDGRDEPGHDDVDFTDAKINTAEYRADNRPCRRAD
jgi:hypothetical protein